MVARLRRLARPRKVIGYRWEGGAPLIIGASPYARLFDPFGAPWSNLFDLRSSLLSLGIAQASLALLSLTRSLHLSPFTRHRLIIPVVTTFAARVASGVVTIRGIRGIRVRVVAAVLRRSVVP